MDNRVNSASRLGSEARTAEVFSSENWRIRSLLTSDILDFPQQTINGRNELISAQRMFRISGLPIFVRLRKVEERRGKYGIVARLGNI